MPDYLELWRPEGHQLVPLEHDRVTLGKADTNDIVIGFDKTVSRVHAVLERLGGSWCVRDLASRNGTQVNGERVWTERPLRDRDEIRLGDARVVFRSTAGAGQSATQVSTKTPPELTARERDVLVSLCRPVLTGDVFTEPSSIRQVAEELVVSEAAVKQHLTKLYDKFGVADTEERRRVRLANEAINRGAVTLADLRGE